MWRSWCWLLETTAQLDHIWISCQSAGVWSFLCIGVWNCTDRIICVSPSAASTSTVTTRCSQWYSSFSLVPTKLCPIQTNLFHLWEMVFFLDAVHRCSALHTVSQSVKHHFPQIIPVPSQKRLPVCFSMQDCVNNELCVASIFGGSHCAFCHWCYGSFHTSFPLL